MEQFTIQKFGDKLKAKITNDNFKFLKTGEMSEVPKKLKKPPKQENLFIEMLPEDVHLYIFQFLSPGSLLKLSMTCQTFNDLSQDVNCWRNMSFKYWRYFLLKDPQFTTYSDYRYLGNQLVYRSANDIPIYGIIEEPKITNSNPQLKSFIDKKPQRLIRKQSSISLLFNQLKNLRQTEDQYYFFAENDYRSYMTRYIESTPNPRNELISKSKSIYQIFKERKERFEELKRKHEEHIRKNVILRQIDNFIVGDLVFFILCVFIFLVALNVHVDKHSKSSPIPVLMIVLLPILAFSCLFLAKAHYDIESSKKKYNLVVSMISFLLFFQILIIGLKSGGNIKNSWMMIFMPTLIFSGVLALILKEDFFGDRGYYIFSLIIEISTIIFLILLGLKLDGRIGLNYFLIFLPLFFVAVAPFLFYRGVFEISRRIDTLNTFFVITIFFSFPFVIFEFLLVCYLQFGLKYLVFALIPFYIEFAIASFIAIFLYIFFSSFTFH
ncbi:f-box only protein [Anaeramoeba ignava]|uniref:F-box only protein n=1 Tax=Anaeramoeba ignava TaxID=1746090 RepID=A0A9Q0LHH8_ANAIG|nr:f-box only protein [Anaeramoeba ignava]